MQNLYPLRLKEILRDYEFGGRKIPETFQKPRLPEEGIIAETWEACCRPDEASEITNGHLAGQNLQDLIDSYGDKLLGTDTVKRFGLKFPLLIKFLDVTYTLAEQAHPNDSMADKYVFNDTGKTEAWYMVKTKPGTTIRVGNKNGATAAEISQSMLTGTAPDYMHEYPIQAGDSFMLHGGTIHYSSGGMILYEIMQNSNAHISLRKLPENFPEDQANALITRAEECIHIEDNTNLRTEHIELQEGANRRTFIFACDYFALERLDLEEPYKINCNGRRFSVITQLEGETLVKSADSETTLKAGNTCLLPASIGEVTLIPSNKSSLLKAYVPDLQEDIITHLRDAGIEDQRIVQLGGDTILNPLRSLI